MKDDETKEFKPANNLLEYLHGLQQSGNLIKTVWKEYIPREVKKFIWSILFWTLIINGLSAWGYFFIGGIVDSQIKQDGEWKKLLLFWTLAMIAGRLISLRLGIIRENVFKILVEDLDLNVFSKFARISLGVHISENSELTEPNIRKGHDKTFELVWIMISGALEMIIMFLVCSVALWFISPKAGAIISVAFVVYLCMSVFLNQRILKQCPEIERRFRHYNRRRIELHEMVAKVVNAGLVEKEKEDLKRRYDEFISLDFPFWIKHIKLCQIPAIINIAALSLSVLITNHDIEAGLLSTGSLMPIIFWMNNIIERLWQLRVLEEEIYKRAPYIESMQANLNVPIGIEIPENPVTTSTESPLPLGIIFENVSLSYAGTSEEEKGEKIKGVFKNLTVTIPPGSSVALIGPSGVGKTSIFRLLLKYMDPTSGRILINGTDIREFDRTSLATIRGHIEQNPRLFSGTIKDNVRYRVGNKITDEEIASLMKECQIDPGDDRFKDGLSTKIGYRGIKLSGGETQRVAMVAEIADPRIKLLLIDEGTSSLDSSTERRIQENVFRRLADDPTKTVIFIAHRLSTVRHICNLFLSFGKDENGCGVLEGVANSFEELRDISPTFKQLLKDQEIFL